MPIQNLITIIDVKWCCRLFICFFGDGLWFDTAFICDGKIQTPLTSNSESHVFVFLSHMNECFCKLVNHFQHEVQGELCHAVIE